MTTHVNPFTAGPVDPSRFIGRKKEVSRIFNAISDVHQGSIAIDGERRSGKTSLLHYIRDPDVIAAQRPGAQGEKAIFTYDDCQLISQFTPTNFWRRILRFLRRQFSGTSMEGEIDFLFDREQLQIEDIEHILDELLRREQRWILLLDEFDRIMPTQEDVTFNNSFLGPLRALANRRPAGLSLVISTGRPIGQLTRSFTSQRGSPFDNIFLNVSLGPFSEEEVDEFFARTLQGTGIEFAEDERQYIRQISGTHPYLMQGASSLIFEVHDSGLGPVENYEAVGRRFEEMVRYHLEDCWEWSSEEEQMLLMLVALAKLGGRLNDRRYDLFDLHSVFASHRFALRTLFKRGLLVGAETEPVIFSSIFEPLVVQQAIINCDMAEIKKRESLFLGQIRQDELEQLQRVVNVVRENSEIIEKVIEWALKLWKGLP